LVKLEGNIHITKVKQKHVAFVVKDKKLTVWKYCGQP